MDKLTENEDTILYLIILKKLIVEGYFLSKRAK